MKALPAGAASHLKNLMAGAKIALHPVPEGQGVQGLEVRTLRDLTVVMGRGVPIEIDLPDLLLHPGARPPEARDKAEALFKKTDQNGDGSVSLGEFKTRPAADKKSSGTETR